jgi:hypothetical protein
MARPAEVRRRGWAVSDGETSLTAEEITARLGGRASGRIEAV